MTRDLKEFLRGADLSDDKVFSEAVRRVVGDLNLTPNDLASGLRVSVPTVRRWMGGVTRPAISVREPLRRFALRKIGVRAG